MPKFLLTIKGSTIAVEGELHNLNGRTIFVDSDERVEVMELDPSMIVQVSDDIYNSVKANSSGAGNGFVNKCKYRIKETAKHIVEKLES